MVEVIEYPKIQNVFTYNPEHSGAQGRCVLRRGLVPPAAGSLDMHAVTDPNLPDEVWDARWVWWEQIDGTNLRLQRDWVRGRTDSAQLPPRLISYAHDLTARVPAEWALTVYGEGVGPKIQGSWVYLEELDTYGVIVFDVLRDGRWLAPLEVLKFCAEHSLTSAAVRGRGTIAEAIEALSLRPKGSHGQRDYPVKGYVLKWEGPGDPPGGLRQLKVKVRDIEKEAE